MRPTRSSTPPAVRIDPVNEWAWCGDRRLALTPRAFAVLRHLVEHHERLITKEELLAAVWHGTIVSDAALASCIRDLRRALRDSSQSPRYIATAHRRGFRFIGPLATPPTPAAHAPLVGRDAELAVLHQRLALALQHHRQLVFVTGEPGIGKTALLDAFLASLLASLRIGRGQCVEQYGAGEAYLPLLEALGRLGRAPDGASLLDLLFRHAPTWLVQLPGLLSDHDLAAVQRRAEGATRDRMLRELVEAFDALTADAPLVLALEDLHWSDSATIDLLAMLARRPDPCRLLVIATYRPADIAAGAHPLRAVAQELRLHNQCTELSLPFFSPSAVAAYLAQRFPVHRLPSDLAVLLHRNTDGNPLFLVNTVDDLVTQGQLCLLDGAWTLAVPLANLAVAAPETLWQMVDKQIERLEPAEQAMLAVASVAGAEFSAAIATVDGIDAREGERRCEALARRGQFLRATGVAEWPDGTVAGQYGFIHALYQSVLYARISSGRRAALHLRTGERLERGYANRTGEIAGELAMHFEQGRDFARAVQYRRQAGEHALRQHGYREAADHATRALELLACLPETPERIEQELTLQSMLGAALTWILGFAAPEVARVYARASELCERAENTPRLFPALLAVGRFHHIRGEVQIALAQGTRLLELAEATGDAAVHLAAHNALGIMSFYAGEFDAALAHLDRGMELYVPQEHSPIRSAAFRAGQDLGVSCAVYAAWTLQLLGYPARAAARMQEALKSARALGHPFSAAYACHFAAAFYQSRRQPDMVSALEDETHAYSTEHGFRIFPMLETIHRGWCLSLKARGEEGLPLIRDGLAALSAFGTDHRRPAFLALLAEAYASIDRPDEALAAVADALAAGEHTGQRYWDAELHRLKGALVLQSAGDIRIDARDAESAPADVPDAPAAALAESCFLEALAIARRQGAKSLELRAATSLGRLWARQGKTREALELVSRIYGWFTEGFDTPDLSDAQALLETLERATAPGLSAPKPRPIGHP